MKDLRNREALKGHCPAQALLRISSTPYPDAAREVAVIVAALKVILLKSSVLIIGSAGYAEAAP